MAKQIFAQKIDEARDTIADILGDIRIEQNKVYKYVLYSGGTGTVAGTAGDVVVYHGDDGVDGNEVTADYTDGSLGAGILAADATDGQYVWIQIAGPCTLSTAIESSNDATPVAAADSDVAVLGDADKTLRRQNTVVDADAEVENVVAAIVDASAKKVLLQFPW